MTFRPNSLAPVAALVVLTSFACEGPQVGPPLSQGSDSGGTAGALLGGGEGGAGGTEMPSTGGSGGTATGGVGTGGATAECPDGLVRGTCPEPEICSEGAWAAYDEPRCEACGIVSCPASVPDCCTGFRVLALTAGTFLPNPDAVTGFTVEATQVAADFSFGQAYEIGAIDLLLPSELPIRSLIVSYDMQGDAYPEFSLEQGTGQVGGVYWDGATYDGVVDLTQPVTCFPNPSVCPTTYNQLKVRLRPYGAGPARLTVTGIAIELE